MGFEYGKFVSSGLGKQIANTLGLPRPTTLRRHTAGAPLINGAVLVDGHGDAPVGAALTEALSADGIQIATSPSTSVAGVVVDMTRAETPADLETLAPCEGTGSGDWTAGALNLLVLINEMADAPPKDTYQKTPEPGDQPTMPDADTAPAVRFEAPEKPDVASIVVPARPAD